jgi:predicted transcriptional regulator
MKPIDFRNETWRDVELRVEGLRRDVYYALAKAGACTTRQLAEKSGIDLLTVRPRVTELYQIGLVELVNEESGGGEGIYRTIPWPVARANFDKLKLNAAEKQLNLL